MKYFLLFVSILCLALKIIIPANADVVNKRINGEFTAQEGDIKDYKISPDNNWIVYRADQDQNDQYEVYSVSINGGTSVKLNIPLNSKQGIVDFDISSDSSRVVYVTYKSSTWVSNELYSVPIEGGTSTKLYPNTTNEIRSFMISSDSAHVIFLSEQSFEKYELFKVPITGGAVTTLNDTLNDDETISRFTMTPDSSRVIFICRNKEDWTYQLLSVPLTGGSKTLLSNHGIIRNPLLTQNSNFAIYKSGQQLYSVPTAGGSIVKLNGELVEGGQVGNLNVFTDVKLSPNSNRVVYWADQDTDEVFELYSVPTTGGTAIKLNSPLVPGGDVSWDQYQISPDSNRVVYIADQDTDGKFEIYSVSITGGTAVKLNAELPADGDVDCFEIDYNSSFVYYIADQETDGMFELFKVPITGGISLKISNPLVEGGSVKSCLISPNSTRLVYQADQDTLGADELYSVSVLGGLATKLNDPVIEGGDIADNNSGYQWYNITSNSKHVIYVGDQDCFNVHEIYSVPLDGGDSVKLNDALAVGGSISGFEISSDSKYIVYQSDQDIDGQEEIYSVRIEDGSVSKLNGTLVPDGRVAHHWFEYYTHYYPCGWGFKITPDSNRVIYRVMQENIDSYDLYSVPIDGGTPVKLNNPLPEGSTVYDFEISPDSTSVVYLANQDSEELNELYSVPVTGGSPQKLNRPFDTGYCMEYFKISNDSKWVLFSFHTSSSLDLYISSMTGEGTTRISENIGYSYHDNTFYFSPDSNWIVYRSSNGLYSVPVAGGEPVKIGGDFIARQIFISPDSSRVVFASDQVYSVPISGGEIVALNDPWVDGGGLESYYYQNHPPIAISPDSSRVVYRADQDTVDVFELYSVPIDGGIVTKLNSDLVSRGEVSIFFSISTDSKHVVYIANQDNFYENELYSVPIEGGPVIKLNGDLVDNTSYYDGNVGNFQISNSNTVIYFADQETDNIFELYKAPISGGQAIKVNGDLCQLGTVSEYSCTPFPGFYTSPNSQYVIYMASQDYNNQVYLYSTNLFDPANKGNWIVH